MTPRILISTFIVFSLFLPGKPVNAAEPLASLRGAEIEIGGELELEIIDSQADGTVVRDGNGNILGGTPNPNSRMSIDKIVITPKVRFNTGILFQADIEFGPSSSKIDEAWIKIPGLPFNSWIKFGLEDTFHHPSRKTEAYPIVGHAFWQDEDLGLFMGGEQGSFYWRFSATNGRRLRDRQAGEDAVFPITTDDDDNAETNANKQVGLGLGLDHSFKEAHKIDILPFYFESDLSAGDMAYLNAITTYAGGTQDKQSRYGLNLDYVLRGFSFFGQIIMAEDGGMDRDGWYIQPSYTQKIGMARLQSMEFLVRYEEYNVDLVLDPSDSRTWNRQRTTLAILSKIVPGFTVKVEYYINEEDTGGAKVDNNEALVQLEAKF